ncbi:unnamed protein product [Mytilus coruscus]|uniref:Uncharacterized protein n=1 Tax=Mytilus coruscus TaxID=42192 RepID=A0A6J8EY80_MYTCO|nr:unnamed protein product [Mytilus coruscus]
MCALVHIILVISVHFVEQVDGVTEFFSWTHAQHSDSNIKQYVLDNFNTDTHAAFGWKLDSDTDSLKLATDPDHHSSGYVLQVFYQRGKKSIQKPDVVLNESTIQHGQGFISSTPRGQGVRPKVVENKEHDSGVVTAGPSLSTPVGLAMGDTLPLPDRDIITNPQVNNRKSIGQDKFQNINPKQESEQNQSTAHTVSSGSNDVKIKPSKYDGLTPWMDYLSHF